MPNEKHRFQDVILPLFARNWITLIGASLTTVSALTILGFVVPTIAGIELPVYIGMLVFLILPGGVIAGLSLMPLGHLWHHYRIKRMRGDLAIPPIDISKRTVRHGLGILLFLTAVNFFLVGTVSYKAVVYMDSVAFCGTVCHTVMEPEYTAYQESAHSRVACVECHIGPGAPWFVQAKISGVRQVLAVAVDSFSRPIPSPVEHLRPSRDTCEHCHWPERFTGDRVRVIHRYQEDEANTQLTSVLLMHIGGGNQGGPGIHSWHIDPSKNTTYFATDKKRQEIALVRVTEPDGKVTEFKTDGFELTPEVEAAGEWRTMDCMDCHNRPSHAFEMPAKALDTRIDRGLIDPTLPFIKKVSLETLLEAEKAEDPHAYIAEKILTYYEQDHAEILQSKRAEIDAAVETVQQVFKRNVFPEMNVGWGTYPLNIGHEDFPGCFRCHDDLHRTESGQAISSDCMICHTPLAMMEENPEILTQLGI